MAPADSRFCAKTDSHTVLYASPDFATTFVETVVRDRFIRKQKREVLLKEVTERVWAGITTRPGNKLKLIDLRNDGCIRLGAPTDVINARSHRAGRALARVIYSEYECVDGFLFPSRLTGADVYAVFDRGIERLYSKDKGTLIDHPELRDVLTRYNVGLCIRR